MSKSSALQAAHRAARRAKDQEPGLFQRGDHHHASRGGGGDRIRTDDPLLAKQVLSQLSYSPRSTGRLEVRRRKVEVRHDILPSALILLTWLVGLGRFELPTSRLSGVRSNQLSYRPSNAYRSVRISPATYRRRIGCQRAGNRAGSLKTEQDRRDEDNRYSDSYRPRVPSQPRFDPRR